MPSDYASWPDDRINAEVARRCGWELSGDGTVYRRLPVDPFDRGDFFRANFATSLDAMREAEGTMNRREFQDFTDAIVPPASCEHQSWYEDAEMLVHATPRQRAIAFLAATEGRENAHAE